MTATLLQLENRIRDLADDGGIDAVIDAMPALLEDEYETGIETWQDGHLAGVAWAIEELERVMALGAKLAALKVAIPCSGVFVDGVKTGIARLLVGVAVTGA